jgi:hypothetical protein
MCWSFLPHVRFFILLTVFELLPKTCNFAICSIFSNSGHVGCCTASPDTILKLDQIFKILILFVLYFKNYNRQMVSWNCKHAQHVKIYLPCNFEVNLNTHLGVIALFSSIFFFHFNIKILKIWWKKGNNSKMSNGIYFKIAG